MSFMNRILGKAIFSQPRKAHKPIRKNVRLHVEALEERWCPANPTGVVTVQGTPTGNIGGTMYLSTSASPATLSGQLAGTTYATEISNTFQNGVWSSANNGTSSAGTITTGTGDSWASTAVVGSASGVYSAGTFSGSFHVSGKTAHNSFIQEYGNVQGTFNLMNNSITGGTYTATITVEPNDINVWNPPNPLTDDNWNTASNWSDNTVPGAGYVAVFDASYETNSASACTINTNTAEDAILLKNGYGGTGALHRSFLINQSCTFNINSYSDDGNTSNGLNITWQSGVAGTANIYDNGITDLRNFDWEYLSGAFVNIYGNVNVGQAGAGGYTCIDKARTYVESGGSLNIGKTKYSSSSQLQLSASSSGLLNILSGGTLNYGTIVGVAATNGGTSATINVGGSMIVTSQSTTGTSELDVPIIVAGSGAVGTLYVGGTTYSGSSAGVSLFVNAAYNGNDVTMTNGQITLINKSILNVNTGYKQTGGDLNTGDTNAE